MELIPGYNFYTTKLIEINKIRKFSILVYLLLFLFSVLSVNAQEDTGKVKELLNSAKDKTKPFADIIKICDEAITVSNKINYQQGKADALNIKGRAYLKLGEYPGAMTAFFEELTLREKNTEWENSSAGNVYNMIGESYRAVANYYLAIEYLNKALKINEEKKDEKEIANTYNRLAAVYYEMSFRWNDTSANYISEEYAKKSLEISGKLKDNDLTISSYNIIGAVYSSRKDFDNALKYFFLALVDATKDTTYADRPNILN
ncbi:MAG: tetratricopeptide repeat protein, partial [Ignavibacteriae bacterium]|nr:tetratricopeptide repeat protein [Ignavibacteriota bacterium]